jgi:hypothetical protein
MQNTQLNLLYTKIMLLIAIELTSHSGVDKRDVRRASRRASPVVFDPALVAYFVALSGGGRGSGRASTAAGSMTRETALLLFNSVCANVSTIYRISFACTQGRIETK